jgi:acyl carrier protein
MSTLPPISRNDEHTARLLHFVNHVLPGFDRRGKKWRPVSAADSLFTEGRLDSLNILHLIAAVEEITGAPVPDHMVVMKHFQSVEAITAAFCRHES